MITILSLNAPLMMREETALAGEMGFALLRQKMVVAKMKVEERWVDRKARMHPQHSRMEEDVFLALYANGVLPRRDEKFPIQTTTPDFYFPEKRLAVYLDGEKVHFKRQDRDETIRELLRKRHKVKVLSITYKGNSERERQRILKLILEALK